MSLSISNKKYHTDRWPAEHNSRLYFRTFYCFIYIYISILLANHACEVPIVREALIQNVDFENEKTNPKRGLTYTYNHTT